MGMFWGLKEGGAAFKKIKEENQDLKEEIGRLKNDIDEISKYWKQFLRKRDRKALTKN